LNLYRTVKLTIGFILQKTITNHPIFQNVTKIEVDLNNEWPLFSLRSLSVYINISQIVQIKMDLRSCNEYNQNIVMDIGLFLDRAYNLSSLIFDSNRYNKKLIRKMERIHSIVPRHVKHLQILIDDVSEIKAILERCQYLSTIQLDLRYTKISEEVIKWFAENTIDSTCLKGYKTVAVWLGKKQIQSDEISVDHKRIKIN
jgi:hypothetical protein